MAAKYAILFARKFRARIVLLHVVEKQNDYPEVYHSRTLTPEQIKSAAEKFMAGICVQNSLKKPLLQDAIVMDGVPHDTICEMARGQNADLIIMAPSSRTGLAHVFLGSTTEKEVRHAPCLVLAVPASRFPGVIENPEKLKIERSKHENSKFFDQSARDETSPPSQSGSIHCSRN